MRNIIIDCDPGHDDAIALLLATRADSLKVLGVTTVAGNSELHYTTVNALKILNYAGVEDIPVYAGCSKPLMRELYRLTGAKIHGADGLGGPSIPAPVQQAESGHAVDYLVRTLRRASQPITLVATGPLTNVAAALAMDPAITQNIDRIVIMGGAVREPGNVTSAAEFNIFLDPEAAKIVFTSGCELYLNSLDVTMKALLYQADIDKLAGTGNKVSKVVSELLTFFAQTHQDHFGFFACPIHDALCIGCLIDDSLVEFEKTFVDISTADELTRGETVADLWNVTGNVPNAHIAVKVDRDKFADMIFEYMQKDYISK